MRSPNAAVFPTPLVLVADDWSIDSSASGYFVLVESRRVRDGIFFHYRVDHSLTTSHSFHLLASPNDSPRFAVDAYIV